MDNLKNIEPGMHDIITLMRGDGSALPNGLYYISLNVNVTLLRYNN